jgi:hypothetical protein
MRTNLAEHRADFERLVRMANEDYARSKVIRIAYDFTRLESTWAWPRPEVEWGISGARWHEYRALFQLLDLPAGLDRTGPRYENIHLMVYGVGLAGEGREYGYLFSRTPPTQIQDPGDMVYATKPLEGNWYVYEWVVN